MIVFRENKLHGYEVFNENEKLGMLVTFGKTYFFDPDEYYIIGSELLRQIADKLDELNRSV